MRDEMAGFFMALAIGAAILVFVAGGYVFAAHQEARSFSRLTGRTDVTWWDALWVQLRVDCEQ